jgi:hypothetical protein
MDVLEREKEHIHSSSAPWIIRAKASWSSQASSQGKVSIIAIKLNILGSLSIRGETNLLQGNYKSRGLISLISWSSDDSGLLGGLHIKRLGFWSAWFS